MLVWFQHILVDWQLWSLYWHFYCFSELRRPLRIDGLTAGPKGLEQEHAQYSHTRITMLARISRRSGLQGLQLLDARRVATKSSLSASWSDPSKPNLIDLAKMSQIGITEQEVNRHQTI